MDESNSVDTLESTGTSCRYATAGRYTMQTSLITQPKLCEQCCKKQSAKIQELNSFEPLRECDFQSELDIHKGRLDERYKLCQSCHRIVIQHLKTQAVDLKTCLLGNHLQQSKSTPTKLLKRSPSQESVSLLLVQLACVLLASLLVPSELLSGEHHTCDESLWFWNRSLVRGNAFFSNFKVGNITSMAKHLVLHFTTSVRITSSSFLELGKELLLCLSSLTKRRCLHVSLLCLLLNIIIFFKRKTRFGVLTLISWTLLSVLRCCELFWWKADCRWRFTGVVFCWFLNASLLLFCFVSYSGVMRVRGKRRFQSTPSRGRRIETHLKIESEITETENKSATPTSDKIATDLDWNLNGLSLGLPLKRKNGYKMHLSPENSGGTGSFWSQNLSGNDRESPLVSMRQRPLIVPATLHYSGFRLRRNTGHTQVSPRFDMTSGAFSSDDDSDSDSVGKEHLTQSSRMYCNKHTSEEKPPRKIKRAPLSSEPQTLCAIVWTFLLITSLFLNLYFIFFFTEWPVRLVHLLLQVYKR